MFTCLSTGIIHQFFATKVYNIFETAKYSVRFQIQKIQIQKIQMVENDGLIKGKRRIKKLYNIIYIIYYIYYII